MCLRYDGLRCLLIRRSLAELKSNHVGPFLKEYGSLVQFNASDMALLFSNGSRIDLGYCDCDRDALRYQGQEYDVIAIDEATQLSELRFSALKACLRGTRPLPRRMYLTCNPGGIGHAWVKRLFVDRRFRPGEDPEDYRFIPARVYDNRILTDADPDYVRSLESLPPRMRDAWLYGRWDVFEGQFFPEFDPSVHAIRPHRIPTRLKRFVSMDYGFDMLAALLMGVDEDGRLFVLKELCIPDMTLTRAAAAVSELCRGQSVEFAVASPDLWNRRQDSGKSGFELMQAVYGMPPMIPADDRRIPGWRMVREYLARDEQDSPRLFIPDECSELLRCMPALLCNPDRPEDASGEPHSITHAPEALRYGIMSRCPPPLPPCEESVFRFPRTSGTSFFDD